MLLPEPVPVAVGDLDGERDQEQRGSAPVFTHQVVQDEAQKREGRADEQEENRPHEGNVAHSGGAR